MGEDDGPLELGLAALHDGDVELAEQHFLRAWQDGVNSGDTELAADASLQLSAIARKKRNLNDAEMWYQRAVSEPAPPQPTAGAELAAQAERENLVLNLIWRSHLQWSKVASTAQKSLNRWRLSNLFLLVLGAAAAALSAQTWLNSAETAFAAASAALLATAGFIQGQMLSADSTSRWTGARAASEALKAETYRYLTKVKPYRGADRAERLQAQLDTIQTRAQALLVDQQVAAADDRPLPQVTRSGGT